MTQEETFADIGGLLKKLAITWTAVSLLTVAGAVWGYVMREKLDYQGGAGAPAVISLILMAGSICWIVSYFTWPLHAQSRPVSDRLGFILSRPWVIPAALFFSLQILTGGLVTLVWLYLPSISSVHMNKLYLLTWAALSYLIPFIIILFIVGKNNLTLFLRSRNVSMVDAAIFLFSFISAAFIGLVVGGSILNPLKNHYPQYAGLSLYAILGLGLSFLVFDLLLCASIFISKPVISVEPWAGLKVRFSHHRTGIRKDSRAGRVISFLSHPLVISLVIAVAFFLIYLAVLRPGFETDDDIGMISMVSGYLSGQPTALLVYSNVVIGFILKPLFALQAKINWYTLLLLLVNFLSVWALLQLILSRPINNKVKFFGSAVVLLCASRFLLSINFTTIAAFASLSGFCQVLMAVHSPDFKRGRFLSGTFLVFMGSLIRLESMELVLVIILPAVILSYRSFFLKYLILASLVIGVLVYGFIALNTIYWRSSKDWSAYMIYDQTRSMLLDTPRLTNMDGTISEVGWGENDLVMFVHWFFPDRKTYSLENLQYLIAHVPDKRSLTDAVTISLGRVAKPASLPYMLLIMAAWIAMLLLPLKRRAVLSSLAVIGGILAVNFYLAWTYKLPDRVELSMLATGAIFTLFILDGSSSSRDDKASFQKTTAKNPRLGLNSIFLLIGVAIVLVLSQSLEMANLNIRKQTAYRGILSELNALQSNGKIRENALIVSPSVGIPLEWSNPLVLDFPSIHYLSMGWITFSPLYDQVLREYGVQSLPEGLYQNDNVYLMERSNIMFGILTYIRQHDGVDVKGEAIYAMPDDIGDPIYDDVHLYKIDQEK